MSTDLRTHALVLRRTNYGESDRILNLLTPEGKYAVLAKGARKEKSKLAGGIELFSVGDVVIHQGKGNLALLTSASLVYFYRNIISDITSLELASDFLKKAEKVSEQTDNPDYFDIVNQSLAGLDRHYHPNLVKTWFILNLAQALGEEINLSTDVEGEGLNAETKYFWDSIECALRPHPQGQISASGIKLTRLILATNLSVVARIASISETLDTISPIARTYEQI